MRRGTRRGAGSRAPEVLKAEVSDKYLKIRLIAAIIFLMIAAVSIGYGVSLLVRVEGGWQTISASGDGALYAEDFVFTYELGAAGRSAKAESGELKQIYSEVCLRAGRAFDANAESTGGLYALNQSPNQVVELDPVLYDALELLEKYGDRRVYLGPAFRLYENLFTCTEDWQLEDFDPEQNEMLRELFGRIADFAGDPDSVHVELLDGYQGRLCLSGEYLDFLQYEELGGALDFGWMKNAFITDFIADTLAGAGYTRGSVTSYDGYTRNLDDQSGAGYSLNLFDLAEGAAIWAARFDYQAPMAFVSYRCFPVTDRDAQRMYTTAQGEHKTLYLSPEDALPRTGAESFTVYSGTLGCAELLLLSAPVFQQEEIAEADLARLSGHGVECILAAGRRLLATQEDAAFANVYDGYTIERIP